MSSTLGVRGRVKKILRPAAMPLLRRFRLPFEIMLPRIENLEQRFDTISATLASPATREAVENLRGTVGNLTRSWLRLQNEVSRLAVSVPEAAANAAANAVQGRLADFEARLQDAETHTANIEQQLQENSRLREEGRQRAQQESDDRNHRVDDTLRFLLDRVEFVRRELMFELRYASGGASVPQATAKVLQSRILAPEKVEAARASGTLRLNLGCGHISDPDYINVDMRELPGVDVIAEAGALPFEPASIDEIFSAHLVEHFPQEEMRRRLLPHWRNLLKPDGRLRTVTPDGETMLANVAQGNYSFEDFREVLFGGQDYEGDFHYNLFTPDSLGRLVTEAGFTEIDVPVRGRRNGQCFEFELVARAPAVERTDAA